MKDHLESWFSYNLCLHGFWRGEQFENLFLWGCIWCVICLLLKQQVAEVIINCSVFGFFVRQAEDLFVRVWMGKEINWESGKLHKILVAHFVVIVYILLFCFSHCFHLKVTIKILLYECCVDWKLVLDNWQLFILNK